MFKIVTMMVILSTGIKAFAFMPLPLKCWNENQQTLEVSNMGFSVDGTPLALIKFFNGETVEMLKGIDKSTSGENEILMPLGDSLKVATPRFHGGRCGRCAPSDELPSATNYFAKLTLGSDVYSFQCTSL